MDGIFSTRKIKGWGLYAALGLLYLLHNDLWLWNDARLVLGLPVGLVYHLGYCLAAALLFAALVRWAWPPPWVEEAPMEETPADRTPADGNLGAGERAP